MVAVTSLDSVPFLLALSMLCPPPLLMYRVKTQILSGLGGRGAAGVVASLGLPSLGSWGGGVPRYVCLVVSGRMAGGHRLVSLCGEAILVCLF